MCFICSRKNKPIMTGFFGTLANLSIRLKLAFRIDTVHMSVFTDIALNYLYCI